MALTAAEQNRLVLDSVDLVKPIATRYRGQKDIPFEEICAEGMAGLVDASRSWRGDGVFGAYAIYKIRGAILDFISGWDRLEPDQYAGVDHEKLLYEWQNGFFALYERWTKVQHSPWDLHERFQDVSAQIDLMSVAYRALSKRDRQMVEAYFIDEPRVPLGQIAKNHRMSYKATETAIWRALGKMREIVQARREPVAA